MGTLSEMSVRRHAPRSRIIVALVALSVGLVAVPALSSAAAVHPELGSTTQEWAYGAHWSGHRSGWASLGTSSGTFAASAVFGWEAILTQANTSASTFAVTVQWTAAAELWVTYCSPGCTNPSLVANLTDRALEQVHSVTNYSTDAAVMENGQSVAAVGIIGAQDQLSANLSENSSVHGTALGPNAHSPTRALLVKDVESTAVAFAPTLGLYPEQLSSPSSWTSSSTYSGLGTWNASWDYNAVALSGRTTSFESQVSGSIPSSGPVWVNGSTQGSAPLSGASQATVVGLTLGGPFTLLDGGLLVPSAAEIMHSAGSSSTQEPWAGDRMGNQTVRLLDLDVLPGESAHVGLVASAMTYASTGTSPSVNSFLPETTALSSTNQTGSATVQAEPQSVSAAEAGTDCLEAGVDCGGGPAGLSPAVVQTIVVVGAAVGIAALLAVVVVERRRLPPPTRSSATQYQPGVARTPDSPSGARVTPGSSPPTSEPADPLDNLW